MNSDQPDIRLVYFADPMCSWCWGFSPVIEAIRDHYRDRLPVQMIMGGLNPGNRQPLDAEARQQLKQHWLDVQRVTAQPFNFDFFERDRFVYDTGPASRAVVSCFRIQPASSLAFMQHLQAAFYNRNLDISDDRILLQLAQSFGLDEDRFRQVLHDAETERIAGLGFAYARHLQVTGFPTLFGQTEQANTLLTRGYQALAPLQASIDQWLQRE